MSNKHNISTEESESETELSQINQHKKKRISLVEISKENILSDEEQNPKRYSLRTRAASIGTASKPVVQNLPESEDHEEEDDIWFEPPPISQSTKQITQNTPETKRPARKSVSKVSIESDSEFSHDLEPNGSSSTASKVQVKFKSQGRLSKSRTVAKSLNKVEKSAESSDEDSDFKISDSDTTARPANRNTAQDDEDDGAGDAEELDDDENDDENEAAIQPARNRRSRSTRRAPGTRMTAEERQAKRRMNVY
ncbi:hypothetical protein HK096_004242 [Nowakowskiella sp. JEL0078]|nr:hypothetical protein HK096_004242 [Nowakowskiella sp. JEL0078]